MLGSINLVLAAGRSWRRSGRFLMLTCMSCKAIEVPAGNSARLRGGVKETSGNISRVSP
jgi:hypothetical protein